MNIYLDNAATTPLAPEVIAAMQEALVFYGNPSSTHAVGRKAKLLVEQVRKQIADELGATPSEIVFTSGGSEADNWALMAAVRDLGVQHIITSAIEHHAVLHTAEFLRDVAGVTLHFVKLLPGGVIDLEDLEQLLQANPKSLVSLMHANNEIGNLLDLNTVAQLCKQYGSYFHSDTVQTIGHYRIDVRETPVDFLAAAAHKFHGPKGIGFAYVRSGLKIKPLIHGGAQERGMRGGTENLIGIAGLGKAFELAYRDLATDTRHIQTLKNTLIAGLQKDLPQVQYNGQSGTPESLYTVLNLAIPHTDQTDMLLFSLDLKGIAVSGGSACQSGSQQGSHVIRALQTLGSTPTNIVPVRVSMSRYTTAAEVLGFLKGVGEVLG